MASLQLTLDPTSLILSQFDDPTISNNTLRLVPDSYLERGVNYDEYAQLRESSLRSKRLNLYNIDAISETPVSEYSPNVMKSVQFHGNLGEFEDDDGVSVALKSESSKKSVEFHGLSSKFEEDELVYEIPKSEYSPSGKKSVKFNGICGKFEEDELVSAIPRLEYSPLVKKSVKFNGISGKFEEDELVSAIPRSEYSPSRKKSVKFNGISGKFGEDGLVSAVPRSEYSPLMKKSVKFNGISGKFEEDERVSATPKSNLLRKSVRIHEISKRCEEISPLVKKTIKTQGKNQGTSVSKKENRNPTPEMNRNTRIEKNLTPPVPISKRGKINDSPSKYSGTSKTINSGEKQSSLKRMMSRKSYASIEELKGLSICASNAINSEFRGGKKSNVLRKSTVFSTKYY